MIKARALLCVDMGTTRTRVWFTLGTKVRARASGEFGVRNVSIGQDVSWLRTQLIDLLREVSSKSSATPEAVLAAGMITSSLGLREVPHIEAPVDASELAARLCIDELAFAAARALPFLMVPGVRTSAPAKTPQDALAMDLMRGEETLCMGLLANGRLNENTVLLNLGSHWKSIWVNDRAQIVRSRTTLTGEMIHAVQTHTLLASSLPQRPPRHLSEPWLQYGFDEAQRNGLGRTLFAVRLLHLSRQGTAEQRLAFLYGAFMQAELAQMSAWARDGCQMLVAGSGCLIEAWMRYAQGAGIGCTVLHESEREQAYLAGLLSLYEKSAFAL